MRRQRPRIAGIGIDVVELSRAAAFVRRYQRQLKSFFLPHEYRAFLKSKQKTLAFAYMFAAKEAASKALGIQVVHPRQFQQFSIQFYRRWIVRYLGDPPDARMKRITLRPFKQEQSVGMMAFSVQR